MQSKTVRSTMGTSTNACASKKLVACSSSRGGALQESCAGQAELEAGHTLRRFTTVSAHTKKRVQYEA